MSSKNELNIDTGYPLISFRVITQKQLDLYIKKLSWLIQSSKCEGKIQKGRGDMLFSIIFDLWQNFAPTKMVWLIVVMCNKFKFFRKIQRHWRSGKAKDSKLKSPRSSHEKLKQNLSCFWLVALELMRNALKYFPYCCK